MLIVIKQTRLNLQSNVYRGCEKSPYGGIDTSGRKMSADHAKSCGVAVKPTQPKQGMFVVVVGPRRKANGTDQDGLQFALRCNRYPLLHDFDSLPTVGQLRGCWRTISLSRQFKDRVYMRHLRARNIARKIENFFVLGRGDWESEGCLVRRA